MVEQSIPGSNELAVGQGLLEQEIVQSREGFIRSKQARGVVVGVPGDHALLDENGQQSGSYAMAHRIGQVERGVFLVHAEDVEDVAGDPGGRAEQ